MKIMVASDLHGSAFYTEKLFEAFEREQPERLLLLGDLLYHGPRNALPAHYETMRTAELLNQYKDVILTVQGNCDAEVDQCVLDFPIFEANRTLLIGSTRIFATHGHKYGPHNVPNQLGAGDILLCGHTHVPAWEALPYGIRYFNPGSVSIPKGGSCHSYMLLTDLEALWIDLETGNLYHSERIDS